MTWRQAPSSALTSTATSTLRIPITSMAATVGSNSHPMWTWITMHHRYLLSGTAGCTTRWVEEVAGRGKVFSTDLMYLFYALCRRIYLPLAMAAGPTTNGCRITVRTSREPRVSYYMYLLNIDLLLSSCRGLHAVQHNTTQDWGLEAREEVQVITLDESLDNPNYKRVAPIPNLDKIWIKELLFSQSSFLFLQKEVTVTVRNLIENA